MTAEQTNREGGSMEIQIIFFTVIGYVFGEIAGYSIGRKHRND